MIYTLKKARKENLRINSSEVLSGLSSTLKRFSSWSGYDESYVQNIIKGAMTALTLLATLTFDPTLLFWTLGLKNHLKTKMEEAEKEKKDLEKYKF